MTSYGFRVYGIPVPQGSKTPGVSAKTGKLFVRDQSGQSLKTWRQDVKRAALIARGVDPEGPVDVTTVPVDTITKACSVQIQFLMPKPVSVKRSLPSVRPDLDKLIRGVLDALKEAGVYKDDGQVVKIWAIKIYAGDTTEFAPGAWITVSDHLD